MTDKPMTLPELSAAATQAAEVYSRELDITNADHIALWLDTSKPLDNAIPWLACRIVEAHEIEIAKLHNAYRTNQLVERDAVAGVVEALRDLDMVRDLICEAKGAEGPAGGYVTDHLDAAEGWLDRVSAALTAIKGGDDADG